MKKAGKYFLFIIVINIAFLFSPKPVTKTGTYCGEYIHVGKAGFVLFCDSYQYTFLSSRPSLMLDKNFQAVRQNRPLYIYATHIIGLPIKFLTDKFILQKETLKNKIDKVILQKNINDKLSSSPFIKEYINAADINLVYEMLPYYIAYIILNLLILLLAVLVFDKLLNALNIHQHIIYFLSIFIISSGIVKAFFFSAHEQMFAFFAPIYILHSIHQAIKNNTLNDKMYVYSILFGVLCLAYGSFILFFPCFVIALFLYNDKFFSQKIIVYVLFNALIFMLPTLVWIFICKHFAGYYFNGEVENFREFIWIADALKTGVLELINQFFTNTIRYLNPVLQTLPPFIAACIYFAVKNKENHKPDFDKRFSKMTISVFLLFFIFFWLLGYYNFRLSYTCVPIILVTIGIEMNVMLKKEQTNTPIFFKSLKAIAAAWITWSIFKYGPFPFQ